MQPIQALPGKVHTFNTNLPETGIFFYLFDVGILNKGSLLLLRAN